MFKSYLVRPRRHFSSNRPLNIFGPIRIGPRVLLAPTPSPRMRSNFYMGPKAICMILGLCPYTHHYQSNHHAKHTPLPINHHHKICPSSPENDDLWWWRRNRPLEKTQQPIHASLPHPAIAIAIAIARSMPPPPHHNTQNLATHRPSSHPHITTHHRTHTRKIITQ